MKLSLPKFSPNLFRSEDSSENGASHPYSAPDPARIEFEQESGGGFPTVRRRSLRMTVGEHSARFLE
mgnify:CR=1 FL=1